MTDLNNTTDLTNTSTASPLAPAGHFREISRRRFDRYGAYDIYYKTHDAAENDFSRAIEGGVGDVSYLTRRLGELRDLHVIFTSRGYSDVAQEAFDSAREVESWIGCLVTRRLEGRL